MVPRGFDLFGILVKTPRASNIGFEDIGSVAKEEIGDNTCHGGGGHHDDEPDERHVDGLGGGEDFFLVPGGSDVAKPGDHEIKKGEEAGGGKNNRDNVGDKGGETPRTLDRAIARNWGFDGFSHYS